MKNSFAFIFLALLASCSFFGKKKVSTTGAIARVHDEYLYVSDVPFVTKGLKGKDSADALKNYAESWMRKKLLLQKAIENIPEDDIGVTKKVEDYRESLLLYEYEKALINQKLDTVISAQILDTTYQRLKNNFPLKQDVYLLFFIKLKKDAPDLAQARKWITKPKDEDDRNKLEGYCKEFATSYLLDNGMWYEQENIVKNFPLSNGDINALAGSKNFKEFKTSDGIWFIKIADIMRKDSPSPLDFVREPIVKAIIEKRRLQLIERVYSNIYNEALQNKSVEVLLK